MRVSRNRPPAVCATLGMLALGLLSANIIGCGTEDGGRGVAGSGVGGKADDPEGGTDTDADDSDGEGEASAHQENMAVCEEAAERLREHTNSARYEALREVEQERADCLADANNATLTTISNTLQRVGSDRVADVDDVFKQPRSTATGLCNALVEASELALDKAASVEHTACIAQAELHLGRAIDAHADLGIVPDKLPPARDAYSDCYDAFGASTADATSLDVEVDATEDLAACINAAVRDHRSELADRILMNFPGRDAEKLVAEIGSYFERTQISADEACGVLGAAGTKAGDDESALEVAECSVTLAILGGELVGTVITDLAPQTSDDPEPSNDDPDGGTGSTGTTTG